MLPEPTSRPQEGASLAPALWSRRSHRSVPAVLIFSSVLPVVQPSLPVPHLWYSHHSLCLTCGTAIPPSASPATGSRLQEASRMAAVRMGKCGAVPARVSLALLASSGVMVAYMMRVNLSVAIVAMVHPPTTDNSTAGPAHTKAFCTIQDQVNHSGLMGQESDGVSLVSGNFTQSHGTTDQYADTMMLTRTQKELVLGAFFYGYFLTNIPGGWLAEMYGTKWVFGSAILMNSIISLFIPLAARSHFGLLILFRALCGLGQGMVYPAMNVMVARWIPPIERPRFMSFTFFSSALGTVITMPLCGVIIASVGWPAVFYVSGAVSLLWVLLWTLLMHDTPKDHPRINPEERRYILDAVKQGTTQKPSRTPWRSIFTSVPLWATHTAHIGSMFGFNLLLTQLPTYMSSILGFSIKTNGLLSSLPFLTQFLGANIFSNVGDWLLARQHITLSRSRKLFAVISLVLPGVVLVTVGYVGCNTTLAVALFTVGTAFSGAICSGHRMNHLDLAPNFSGTISGLSNTLAFAVVMCVPVIVGIMTPDQSLQQWQAMFWLTAAVYVTTCLVFVVFGSTEIQPWNYEQ